MLLMIDNYDSFTYNLFQYLSELGAEVEVIRNDKATIAELAENFALFDDWEDRYRYLIDLGRKLPPMDDDLKTEQIL